MKILAISDIHGSVDALKHTLKHVDLSGIDSIAIAGDFAPLNYDPKDRSAVAKIKEDLQVMFHLLEDLKVKYCFVWGNRDLFFVLFIQIFFPTS